MAALHRGGNDKRSRATLCRGAPGHDESLEARDGYLLFAVVVAPGRTHWWLLRRAFPLLQPASGWIAACHKAGIDASDIGPKV